MDRYIWNWEAVALEMDVMASMAAVPHTMVQPGYLQSWQSSDGDGDGLGVVGPLLVDLLALLLLSWPFDDLLFIWALMQSRFCTVSVSSSYAAPRFYRLCHFDLSCC